MGARLLLMVLGTVFAIGSARAEVLIFAAASLKNALDEAAAAATRETGITIKASYAASGALAKQIEAGAPADLFISADKKWMDYVAEKRFVEIATRRDLLANTVVLVAPKAEARSIDVKAPGSIKAALKDGRLAMGDPASVPAGQYGKAALESLGHWTDVSGQVAFAENVRAALALVDRGEAPLGIVYSTDAKADDGVRVVATFPADSHPPVVYPIARLVTSKGDEAARILSFLGGDAASRIFEAQGFTLVRQTN